MVQEKVKKATNGERRLKTTKFNSKMIFTIGFWSILVLIVFFSYIAFARTNFLNSKFSSFQSEAQKQLLSLNDQGFVKSPAGEQFSKYFVEQFINIPKDPQGRDERTKNLQKMLAENIKLDNIENLGDFKGYRTITGGTLWDITDVKGNTALYVYQISYDIYQPQATGTDTKVGSKNTLIAVRLGTNGENFNVVEQPFYKPIPGDTRIKGIANNLENKPENRTVKDEIQRFATQFFTSYADSNYDQMSFLMKQPESLNGLYVYKGVENLRVYDGPNGHFIVKAMASFQEKESGIITKSPFTLDISKQSSGKFYVNSLKHSLGE